jgi:hypothetical protein
MSKMKRIAAALVKPSLLFEKLWRKPHKFFARRRRVKIDLEKTRSDCLEFLSLRFRVDAAGLLSEYLESGLKVWHDAKRRELRQFTKRRPGRTSDFDCQTLYLLVRAAKPSVVVETGVFIGTSSAHILGALKKNAADGSTVSTSQAGRTSRRRTSGFRNI